MFYTHGFAQSTKPWLSPCNMVFGIGVLPQQGIRKQKGLNSVLQDWYLQPGGPIRTIIVWLLILLKRTYKACTDWHHVPLSSYDWLFSAFQIAYIYNPNITCSSYFNLQNKGHVPPMLQQLQGSESQSSTFDIDHSDVESLVELMVSWWNTGKRAGISFNPSVFCLLLWFQPNLRNDVLWRLAMAKFVSRWNSCVCQRLIFFWGQILNVGFGFNRAFC